MPRIVPLLSLSLAALLAIAAPAAAQGLSSAMPATPGKASTLHFEVDGLAPGLDGRLPTALELTAPGFETNLKALAKRCREQAAKLNECPRKSRMGKGFLLVEVTAPDGIRDVNIPINVYLHSKSRILAVAFVFGWRVVPATISTDGGITIGFDPLPAGPPFEGVTYRLNSIRVRLRREAHDQAAQGAPGERRAPRARRAQAGGPGSRTRAPARAARGRRRCRSGTRTAPSRRWPRADGLHAGMSTENSQPAAAGAAAPRAVPDLGLRRRVPPRRGHRVLPAQGLSRRGLRQAHPDLARGGAGAVRRRAGRRGRLQIVGRRDRGGPRRDAHVLHARAHVVLGDDRAAPGGPQRDHGRERPGDGARGGLRRLPARAAACPTTSKIDIEAADRRGLEALAGVEPDERPRYASIEAESESWRGAVRQFDLLERGLGYTRFAIVQQGNVGGRVGPITTRDGRRIPYRYEMESSGPFGDDLAGPWSDKREALRLSTRRILPKLVAAHAFDQLPKGTEIRYVVSALVDRPLPGWFDIHAAGRCAGAPSRSRSPRSRWPPPPRGAEPRLTEPRSRMADALDVLRPAGRRRAAALSSARPARARTRPRCSCSAAARSPRWDAPCAR